MPKKNAFHRAFVRLTPVTLTAVNDLVVKAAVDLGLEDGTKLRVDTTVVQPAKRWPAYLALRFPEAVRDPSMDKWRFQLLPRYVVFLIYTVTNFRP